MPVGERQVAGLEGSDFGKKIAARHSSSVKHRFGSEHPKIFPVFGSPVGDAFPERSKNHESAKVVHGNPNSRAKEKPSFLKKRSKKLLSVSASAFPDRLSLDEQKFLVLFSKKNRSLRLGSP
jgi:hypothetical protein